MADLIDMLRATLDDPEIFDFSGVPEATRETFKASCAEVWAAIHDNAATLWDGAFHHSEDETAAPGSAMFSRYADVLATDWLSDFRRGILHVAGNTPDERDFLYFMLGMLYAANDEDTHKRWPKASG